ncbi:hypothetical protein [Collimonas pratensis]|uniref:hypothetical protein n=1 Tax=Collimonas pratensis TaxID=279113 RepID=UPI0012E8D413|nr:hypothetical protein [Collimonas pratensis]
MKRRTFISTLPILAYTPFTLAQSPTAHTGKNSTGPDSLRNIDFQLSSKHLQDGNWILWVRVMLKNADFKTNIPLNLIIATDSTFSQIISKSRLMALASHSYISTVKCIPLRDTLLYYKYEINDPGILKFSGMAKSAFSEVKIITPWS